MIKLNKLNIFFLFLVIVYFFNLFFRLFSTKLPKESESFLIFNISLNLIMIFGPMVVIKIIIVFKNMKNTKNRDARETKVGAFFRNVQEKVLIFKKYFFKDFLQEFIGKKRKMRIICFFFIKFFEKAIFYFWFILIFFFVFWLIYVSLIIFEVTTKNYFIFSLYWISFFSLVKLIFLIILQITKKFTVGRSYARIWIYLPKIIKEEMALTFFINNHEMKNRFFDLFQEKNEIIFLWNLFLEIDHFYCLQLKIDQLKDFFDVMNKNLRQISFTIFSCLLISFYFSGGIKYFLFFVLFLFCLFFVNRNLNSLRNTEENQYNKKYVKVSRDYFLAKREELIKTFNLSVQDLEYPYKNRRSAIDLVNEDITLRNIKTDPNKPFSMFEQYSQVLADFSLTVDEAKTIERRENIVIGWFILLREKDLIELDTYQIKK